MNSHAPGSYFFLVLFAGVALLSFFIFEPFLAPLFLAAVFAVVLRPVYEQVCAQMPRWPSAAAFLTVLLAVICILVPLAFVGLQIGFEAADLYISFIDGGARMQIAQVINSAEQFAGGYIPGADGLSSRLSADISRYAQLGLTWLLQHIGAVFSSAAALVLSFLIFFVALYYLLRDGIAVKRAIVAYSPLRDSYDESVFDRLEAAVNSVIRGNLSIALLQGMLSGIGFWIFGVPNPVLWGTVAALGALIPAVGTGVVFVPVILFLFFTGNTSGATGLVIWGVLAVGLIDNFLTPYLIGSGLKLHPLLVLLSVLGGIILFGPIGLFVGPLSLALLFALLSIYADIVREKSVSRV